MTLRKVETGQSGCSRGWSHKGYKTSREAILSLAGERGEGGGGRVLISPSSKHTCYPTLQTSTIDLTLTLLDVILLEVS